MLALPPAYRWNDHLFKNGLSINNYQIRLQEGQTNNDREIDGNTGLTIWDGSIVLSKYLDRIWRTQQFTRHSPNVLELGSGLGLCALTVAALGANEVIATDLPYVLKTLQGNVDRNIATWKITSDEISQSNDDNRNSKSIFSASWNIETMPLDWCDLKNVDINRFSEIDLVIGADIVWLRKLVEPLINTIQFLYEAQNQASKKRERNEFLMILQYTSRSHLLDKFFINKLSGNGFLICRQNFDDPMFGTSDELQILKITKPLGPLYNTSIF